MIFYMYSFESLALTTVGLGMYYDSNLLKIIGVGITCQFGQIYKIHRKSTGTKALNLPDRLLLTSGVFGHHLGTFLFINNNITLGFLTAWRFFSISGHSLALLKDKLKVSKLTLDMIGWTRVFFLFGNISANYEYFLNRPSFQLLGYKQFYKQVSNWLKTRWLGYYKLHII